MKKLKKLIKAFFIIFAIVITSTIISGVTYYHVVTHGVSLNTQKIDSSKAFNLKIYDKNNKEIKTSNNNYIEFNKLNKNTINAFICAEDKRFYKHNGIDFIRVGGAIVSNLKTKSFSEGASTISQQLIKNTHLTNEKTINRKLKEFKLSKELENKYSKNKIIELYLNNIYFGGGAYGIENASMFYFGKSASNLTLAESALLAATINAPSVYNIQTNQEECIKRRNLILNLMKNQNKITEEEFQTSKNETINLNITKNTTNNYVYNEILQETCSILNKNENELKNLNLEIYTNYDQDLAVNLKNQIENNYPEISNYDICNIVIDNLTNTIICVNGTSKNLTAKHQPGSTIKPILVYAPAFENNIIDTETKILDEEININGYSPENADKKYHGFVSVKDALKYSYNVPAVKLLNELGISTAQNFASKLNLKFSPNDNNLAIALGGFTNGLTLKEVVDAYSSFANNGLFEESKYIVKITKNSKLIYQKKDNKTKVMSENTAQKINNILIETSKTGTAKRLNGLSYDVASKTGTVGKIDSQKNSDAYCISYTTNHTIISHISGNNLSESINGSTYPTMINKQILNKLYKYNTPKSFKKLNSQNTQTLNKINQSQTINTNIEAINIVGRKPVICFKASKNYNYYIKRINEKKEETISSFTSIEYDKTIKFEDISAKNNEIYEYFIEICEKSTNKTYKSNHIKLKSY